jgi:phosphatidylinositol phospholipase C delta
MIRETFGDLLYVPSSDTLNEFPSPEALMRRIIISTKPPEEFKEFLKAQDNQKISGKTAKLEEEGSLRRIDSNVDDSDGKVCNTCLL